MDRARRFARGPVRLRLSPTEAKHTAKKSDSLIVTNAGAVRGQAPGAAVEVSAVSETLAEGMSVLGYGYRDPLRAPPRKRARVWDDPEAFCAQMLENVENLVPQMSKSEQIVDSADVMADFGASYAFESYERPETPAASGAVEGAAVGAAVGSAAGGGRDRSAAGDEKRASSSSSGALGYVARVVSKLPDLSKSFSALEVGGGASGASYADMLFAGIASELARDAIYPAELRRRAGAIFDALIREELYSFAQSSVLRAPIADEGMREAERLMGLPRLQVVTSKYNVDILGKDLATLADGEWLNDEVINFHIKMMHDRCVRTRENDMAPARAKLRCLFFNSFFYTKLLADGKYKYKGVSRWSKRQKMIVHEDTLDKVILPINVNQTHWCLAVVNFRLRRFEYYDSLGGRNTACLAHLRQYIVDEAKKYRGEDIDVSDWVDYFPQNIPRQRNGCDCGVFTTKFADYVSQDLDFDFSQADMPYFRRRMVVDIMRGSLI